jgi:hypothetical protein
VTLPGLEGRYVFLYQGDDTFLAENDPELSVTFTMVGGEAVGFVVFRRGITTRARLVR